MAWSQCWKALKACLAPKHLCVHAAAQASSGEHLVTCGQSNLRSLQQQLWHHVRAGHPDLGSLMLQHQMGRLAEHDGETGEHPVLALALAGQIGAAAEDAHEKEAHAAAAGQDNAHLAAAGQGHVAAAGQAHAQHLAGCMMLGHRCALLLLMDLGCSMCLHVPLSSSVVHLCTTRPSPLHLKAVAVQHSAHLHDCVILKDKHVWCAVLRLGLVIQQLPT